MKKFLLTLTVILLSNSFLKAGDREEVPRPKLVVGIMVDQMRWDYLYRYYDRYTDGGFKRLLNEGFSFENTYINHFPSVTAIGHATVFTGTVPSVHGITGNSFIKNSTGVEENCVYDANVVGVGTSSDIGKASPKNLLVTTIGDELRLATNFRSKVIGISFKDRAAILPSGHTANAAYWFDRDEGNWITSTYYMDKLPQWVNEFNHSDRINNYLNQDWNTLFPIDTYIQSTEDDKDYENALNSQGKAVFPVKTSELYSKGDYNVIYSIPYGNSLTLDFAREAIKNESLGQNGITDMLTINLASTDAAGHRFSMNSIEIEDTYLRLDRDLAAFFNYLDKIVGKGTYTVFLSADHGGQHNPQFLTGNKIALNPDLPMKEVIGNLNRLIEKKFGVSNVILGGAYYRLRLDYKKIDKHHLNEQAIRDLIVLTLRKNPTINYVMDLNRPSDAAIPRKIRDRIIHGYYPDRSGDIQIIMGANSLNPTAKGAGHSHWNPYDSKIPLLWFGWGVKKGGKSFQEVYMQDIAPTVTSLLRIQPPNGSIGTARGEVIDWD